MNEKTEKKICKNCGIEKTTNNNYYLSRVQGQTRMEVCKDCFLKEFTYAPDPFDVFKKYNIPFIYNLWESSENDLGKYMSYISSLPQYSKLEWKDSILEEDLNNKEESNFYDSIVKNLKQEAEKLNERLSKLREKNQDMNGYIATLKSLRETLDLISRYDWQFRHSEYKTTGENGELIKQIAIWEQNSDNQIKNQKVWDVKINYIK